MLPSSSHDRFQADDASPNRKFGSSQLNTADHKPSDMLLSPNVDASRWPMEGDMSRQRPFSYVDQSQFKHIHFRAGENSQQQENMLLSDPYLPGGRTVPGPSVPDSNLDHHKFGASDGSRKSVMGGLHENSVSETVSDKKDNGGDDKCQTMASIHSFEENMNQRPDRCPEERREQRTFSNAAEEGGHVGNSHWNVSFSGINENVSNRYLHKCMQMPCASLWAGIFVIAEVVAFCIISSSLLSSTVAHLNQRLLANTGDVLRIRFIYGTTLTLVGIIQILAVIANVFVATSASKYRSHLRQVDNNIRPSMNGQGRSSAMHSRRVLFKHICFKFTQLLIIATFLVLFLFWLILSLALAVILSIILTAPYTALTCDQTMGPNNVLLQDGAKTSAAAVKKELIQSSPPYCIRLWQQCQQNVDPNNCELLHALACDMLPEWVSNITALLVCSLLLVLSMLATLFLQSMNYGQSTLQPIKAVPVSNNEQFATTNSFGTGNNRPLHKPFDRVLAELWRNPRKDRTVHASSENPAANGRCCEL